MKKSYKSGLIVSVIAAAAFMVSASAQAFTHDRVTLRDASGAALAAVDTDADGIGDAVPATAPAYSAKETCGACHAYDAIERHSFHAQLGANEHKGWNAWAMGNWNSIATKGKPWVQSPGHAGKW
ncbi:MAG: hypothetical protein KQH63_15390 [Desulfobulbaceae bacterium]|nr:hypothetical protein [Desulfobulbaceae bacterium]